MWKAKYDEVNAENEQLRLMLRVLLGDSAGDAPQNELIRRKPSSSIQRPLTATMPMPLSQPIVNMDIRGGNITDVGRDVHNHVHNHWVAISLRFVQFYCRL